MEVVLYATTSAATRLIPALPHSVAVEADVVGKVRDKTVAAFGASHWPAMSELITRESGFRPFAVNKSSGACGLFQALPCTKMGCSLEDVECQIDWGTNYIVRRYGTPTQALAFWNQKKATTGHGWY